METFFKIREPYFPVGHSYARITTYLKDQQKTTIQYYRIVMGIGFIGFIFSCLLLLCLIKDSKWNWTLLYNIKYYPGVIYSFITVSFAQIEIENAKKRLYNKLQEVAKNHQESGDGKLITEDYKKWTWQEFQDKFKVQ